MMTREELSALLADEEISDAAIDCMLHPLDALASLEADIGDGPDAGARAEMVRELRAMVQS